MAALSAALLGMCPLHAQGLKKKRLGMDRVVLVLPAYAGLEGGCFGSSSY